AALDDAGVPRASRGACARDEHQTCTGLTSSGVEAIVPRVPGRSFVSGLALVVLLVAGLAVAAPAGAATLPAFSKPLVIPKTLTGSRITLTASQAAVQILPGAAT